MINKRKTVGCYGLDTAIKVHLVERKLKYIIINIFRSYIPSLKIKIKKKKYIQNIPLDRSV